MKQNVTPQNNSIVLNSRPIYKALFSIIIFWICQKICFLFCYLSTYMIFLILPYRLKSLKYLLFTFHRTILLILCNLSLKMWRVKDERWEVCKESRKDWALGDSSVRAGLGVGKCEGDLVPQCWGLIEGVGPTLMPECWLLLTYTYKQFLNWVFVSCT